VHLAELLDNVLDLQQRNLEIARVQVERRYLVKGAVDGFPSELKQVLMNLITNAIQAMPSGGRLRLSVVGALPSTRRPKGIYVFVSDTGTGIEAENLKRLFEPFFSTKSTKGTGLGLWISRGIIQKHDGTLTCRSVRRDTGSVTTFSIWLPDGTQSHSPLVV
jgi:signal transduction histidine kinase